MPQILSSMPLEATFSVYWPFRPSNAANAAERQGTVYGMQTLAEAMMTALGNDSTSLGGAAFLYPIKVPFALTPALSFSNTDKADFTGSDPLEYGGGERNVTSNPVTGNLEIVVNNPEGATSWTTGDTDNLPQTIYGVALGSSSATVEGTVYGAQLFDEPITLTGAGQSIAAPVPVFELIASPLN